jgi:4'-phosphopantetheinyl transferase
VTGEDVEVWIAERREAVDQVLARYLGRVPVYVKGPRGKPALVGGEIEFNVSHSGGLVAVAVARGRAVGVDIERITKTPPRGRIAEHFFAPAEVAALRALPADEQTEAFFRCWTRKEAYLKARGDGLSVELASFAVSLDADPRAGMADAGWSFHTFTPAPGYAGAVVVEGRMGKLTVRRE